MNTTSPKIILRSIIPTACAPNATEFQRGQHQGYEQGRVDQRVKDLQAIRDAGIKVMESTEDGGPASAYVLRDEVKP